MNVLAASPLRALATGDVGDKYQGER
jgi:hypothetical protein